jgi:NAD(P)-dependent dehydrogenase (short-subunit alcohol dehydrogenase family)
VPFFSTVTADWADGPVFDGAYWFQNLRRPVRFAESVRALAEQGFGPMIEVSAHPVLTVAVEDTLADHDGTTALGSLRRNDGGPRRFLQSVAEAHTAGVDVDWARVLEGTGARRADLPTYAFQRRRFWPDAPAAGTGPHGADPVDTGFWRAVRRQDLDTLAGQIGVEPGALEPVLPALSRWHTRSQVGATLDTWRYRTQWESVQDTGPGILSGTWLVVRPETPHRLADAAARALADAGADLAELTVRTGHTDHGQLARHITATLDGRQPEGVLCLTGLDDTPHPDHPDAPAGLATCLTLARALTALDAGAPLWLATTGAVGTGPDDPPRNPAQATLWGAGVVLGLDLPRLWGGIIDLPAELDTDSARHLCGLLGGGTGEEHLAVRPAGPLARRLVRAPAGAATTPWQPRDTVVITGGTGALGGHLARWVARSGADRIVLVSRRGDAADGMPELRDELVDLGAEAVIAACDLADRDALGDLFAKIGCDGPPIRAVLHAAGTSGRAHALEELTTEDVAAVLAPKLTGTRHLAALTEDLELDAFVVFSSGAGTWGDSRRIGYAAANAHLDAFAARQRAAGRPFLSIAWGAWAGGGMVDTDTAAHLHRLGNRPMDPDLAVAALADAVGRHDHNLLVADIAWQDFAPSYTATRARPLILGVPEARQALAAPQPADTDGDEGTALVRELSALDPAERQRLMLDRVRREAATALGHDSAADFPSDRSFRDLGFDSLTVVALRNRLSVLTGLKLATTLVFDHPTLPDLARHLTDRLFGTGADHPLQSPEEAATWATLRTIPLNRLRETGLLDALLELASAPHHETGPEQDPAAGAGDRIDDMNVADLVELALGTDNHEAER